MRIRSYLIAAFLLLLGSHTSAQVKTNLNLFYDLTDSCIVNIKADNKCIKVNNSGQFGVLNNQLYKSITMHAGKICAPEEKDFVSLTVDNAKVEYPEMFRDGFLGAHKVKRIVHLSGNYFYSGGRYKEFSFSSVDTIRVDEIKDAEDASIPFTGGEIPSEPFFSGIMEPIVAIGAAAAIITLYFTVRSK